jgi:hypothetical protein
LVLNQIASIRPCLSAGFCRHLTRKVIESHQPIVFSAAQDAIFYTQSPGDLGNVVSHFGNQHQASFLKFPAIALSFF